MNKRIKLVFFLFISAYFIFGLFLYLFQTKLIYLPTKQDFFSCAEFQDYESLTYNGTRFYYKSQNSDGVLVFYHGNYGSACDRSFLKSFFEESNRDIIFVEYAGYSSDSNKPSMKLILKDAENIADFNNNYSDVLVVGVSLGSSVASYHAYFTDVDRLLLISPFNSMYEVVKLNYPLYPSRLLLRENYNSEYWIKDYIGEVLIIHGSNDVVIDPNLSYKLYNELKTANKTYLLIKDYGHNDLWDSDLVVNSVSSFIEFVDENE